MNRGLPTRSARHEKEASICKASLSPFRGRCGSESRDPLTFSTSLGRPTLERDVQRRARKKSQKKSQKRLDLFPLFCFDIWRSQRLEFFFNDLSTTEIYALSRHATPQL